MTQQLTSPHSSRVKGQSQLLLLQGLGYLLPLSFLSGGIVMAQSSVEPLPSFNQNDSSQLEPIQASETQKEPLPAPDYESVPPMRLNEPDVQKTQSQPQPESKPKSKPKLKPIQPLVNSESNQVPEVSSESAPSTPKQPSTPTVKLEPREATEPNQTPETPEKQPSPSPLPEEKTTTTAINDFIDLNGYPEAGENSLPTPRVEVRDRSNDCTTVVENGKLTSGTCNLAETDSNSQQALVEIDQLPPLPQDFKQPDRSQTKKPRRIYTPPEDLPQLKLPGNGDSALLFPLSREVGISSNYGWRIHPIYGNRRFHTGTDFVAPEGTPVLATKSGRVVLADYTSGYGLIVGLRHDGNNESRYAHLSQIHVQPGQWVEQGTVIGRVGNTGLSTGPHLHFEWRIRKNSRWIAVNAGKQLLAARDNIDPSQINFEAIADANQEVKGNNFLAYLPEILASLPSPPASWMSIPELSFLNRGNFNQAYERKASLASFSQRNNSVLVLPFSLPKVLASLFNWQPPQLFVQENLQRVSTGNQVSFRDQETAYRPPSSFENDPTVSYDKILGLVSEEESLESLSNLEALDTLNFSSPSEETPQAFSGKNSPIREQ